MAYPVPQSNTSASISSPLERRIVLPRADRTSARWRSMRSKPLLRRDQQVPAPVLLVAGLVLLAAEGTLLPVGDGLDAGRRHSQGGEVLAHRGRAAVAERQVVFLGPALVAVALDKAPRGRGLLRHNGGGG